MDKTSERSKQGSLRDTSAERKKLAHDLKNPLSGIRAAIELVGSNLPAQSPDRGVIRQIIERIDSLSELIDERLTSARRARRKRPPK